MKYYKDKSNFIEFHSLLKVLLYEYCIIQFSVMYENNSYPFYAWKSKATENT